jgi:hypothetical protein
MRQKGGNMFFLERKESYAMPNILGGHSMPVHTFRWKTIAVCEECKPLEDTIKDTNNTNYRIITNNPNDMVK